DQHRDADTDQLRAAVVRCRFGRLPQRAGVVDVHICGPRRLYRVVDVVDEGLAQRAWIVVELDGGVGDATVARRRGVGQGVGGCDDGFDGVEVLVGLLYRIVLRAQLPGVAGEDDPGRLSATDDVVLFEQRGALGRLGAGEV